jgi:trehalose/maltose transport system substrate-binding protein
MKMLRVTATFAAVCAFAVAGCGGGDNNEGGGGGAKKAPAAKASGNVTWCIGKDTTGAFSAVVKAFNQQNPKAHAKLLELPESADEQRTQQIQRLRAKSSECDVLGADVIWTTEYAGQNWLMDVSDLVKKRQSEFIPSTLETTKFEGKNVAVPFNTNAGFLYYRTDAGGAPKSWEDVYKRARQTKGLVYQGSRYEGLTVDYLELLYSAGGRITDASGKKLDLDKKKATEVLTFMANGIKDGAVPKAVTTYKEQEALRAFQAGRATFMRNWPYAYALSKKSKIASSFDITTFPSYQGRKGAGVVGGYNLAISAYSKNPAGSAAFIDFATKPDQQVVMASKASLPPVLTSTYDDPKVKKTLPFAAELRTAVEQAKARPVTPVYPQVSEAIYKNVYAALQGSTSPSSAVDAMSSQIEKALKTF